MSFLMKSRICCRIYIVGPFMLCKYPQSLRIGTNTDRTSNPETAKPEPAPSGLAFISLAIAYTEEKSFDNAGGCKRAGLISHDQHKY